MKTGLAILGVLFSVMFLCQICFADTFSPEIKTDQKTNSILAEYRTPATGLIDEAGFNQAKTDFQNSIISNTDFELISNEYKKPTKKIVIDGLGRVLELPLNVERVATNYGIATQIVLALDAQELLVGIDSPSQGNKGFPETAFPDIANLPSVGNPKTIDSEQVLTLHPDLLIVPGRNVDLVDELSSRGITVFGLVAEDMDQLSETVTNLGAALNREDKAAKYNTYYHETVQEITGKTSAFPEDKKPSVYLVGSRGLLSTCGNDMFQNYLIDSAGGKNVASSLSGGWVDVSPEQLITWNPDHIFVVRYQSETTPEDILSDKRFSTINAVKNGNVSWFPSNMAPWDYPSVQAILGLEWLAKTLHEDTFSDLDLNSEANWFFLEFFGIGFSDLGGEF